jgi:hypothetical protein
MFGLLPCQLNSPAPSVMPGTLRNASVSDITARSSINCPVITAMLCGVSCRLSVSFDNELCSTV